MWWTKIKEHLAGVKQRSDRAADASSWLQAHSEGYRVGFDAGREVGYNEGRAVGQQEAKAAAIQALSKGVSHDQRQQSEEAGRAN